MFARDPKQENTSFLLSFCLRGFMNHIKLVKERQNLVWLYFYQFNMNENLGEMYYMR